MVWLAAASPAHNIQVGAAWARATAPLQDQGAVYLTLLSLAGDRLLSVASSDAAGAMLHQTTHSGGMSGMTDMNSLVLPPGQAVRLAPRGTHIMLMHLAHPLVAGSRIGVDLLFEHAGRVHADVPVLPIGSAGP